MKRALALISLILLLLVSCRLSQFNPFKYVKEYPATILRMDNSRFTELGCFDSIDCLPDSLKNIQHPIAQIYAPSNLYAGLNPKLPLAVTGTMSFDYDTEIPSVYQEGCMGTYYVRYLIEVDGEMRLIDSAEEMKELYAPIESEDEALSYAVAVTGLTALNDLDQHPEYKRYIKQLVESHVTFDDNQYSVLLYNDYLCGCGPHMVMSVTVTVQQDGSFTLTSPMPAFSDPEMDDLCVD